MLQRCRMYASAGADAILVPLKRWSTLSNLPTCHLFGCVGADAILVHSKRADDREVMEFMAECGLLPSLLLSPAVSSHLLSSSPALSCSPSSSLLSPATDEASALEVSAPISSTWTIIQPHGPNHLEHGLSLGPAVRWDVPTPVIIVPTKYPEVPVESFRRAVRRTLNSPSSSPHGNCKLLLSLARVPPRSVQLMHRGGGVLHKILPSFSFCVCFSTLEDS